MDFPPNPEPQLRVSTLYPALIAILTLAVMQPFVVIGTSLFPLKLGEATWRFQAFAELLGATPQIAIGLVFIAAIGLFGERYRAVRYTAIVALVLGIILIPVVILDALDYLEVRRLVSAERARAFDLNSLQTELFGFLLAVLLIWLGSAGRRAGIKPPDMDITDVLVINTEPAAGPLDPRVNN
jgi:hypothetical protein